MFSDALLSSCIKTNDDLNPIYSTASILYGLRSPYNKKQLKDLLYCVRAINYFNEANNAY